MVGYVRPAHWQFAVHRNQVDPRVAYAQHARYRLLLPAAAAQQHHLIFREVELSARTLVQSLQQVSGALQKTQSGVGDDIFKYQAVLGFNAGAEFRISGSWNFGIVVIPVHGTVMQDSNAGSGGGRSAVSPLRT